jgi:hypothetical protein
MLRAVALFLSLCIVGLIPAYKLYEFGAKSCDVATVWRENQTTPHKSPQQQNNASANRAQSGNQPQAQQNKANIEATSNGQQENWGHDFWCKATISDFAIAYFTYCLVLVGIFGIWSAEKPTRDSERAHLFPVMKGAFTAGVVQIMVTPQNSGRSAGVQREIFGDFALKKPWGLLPYFGGQSIDYDQVVPAGANSTASAGFTSMLAGPQFFFGYVGYMDLFHRRHKAYFCVRATPPQAPGAVLMQWSGDDWRSRWLNRFY